MGCGHFVKYNIKERTGPYLFAQGRKIRIIKDREDLEAIIYECIKFNMYTLKDISR